MARHTHQRGARWEAPTHLYATQLGKRITEKAAEQLFDNFGNPTFRYFYRGVEASPGLSPVVERRFAAFRERQNAIVRRARSRR